MFYHRHMQGVASLARSFSRITLTVERSPNAVLPLVATPNGSNVSERFAVPKLPSQQLRPPAMGGLKIANNIRRNPLVPLKEIIDIPLVSRIIENPIPRPGTGEPIGDNLNTVPTLDLPTGIVQQDDRGKQAARLIVIRRRKMRKHKLKKLRKRMKFEWLKVRQRRELRKEKLFQAELINQIKEAEKFSAEAYVAEKLRLAKTTPLPRFWKGRRLPEFLIKQKLGIE
ncbi:uncharacterized protein LOC131206577 [Anopheles bellator]|uniref:uncharacterized protein LOC131206577 n=1 Tax=Anopheles bellator TaxID=139047 RepID=UPI002648CEFC|nr:uncharacterized protein LOC131206577 [Anopheles bellator]